MGICSARKENPNKAQLQTAPILQNTTLQQTIKNQGGTTEKQVERQETGQRQGQVTSNQNQIQEQQGCISEYRTQVELQPTSNPNPHRKNDTFDTQPKSPEEKEIEEKLQTFKEQFSLLSDMLKQMTDEFQKLSSEFQEAARQEQQY